MSRIGKTPIPLPNGVNFTNENGLVTVKGPKGTLSRQVSPDMILDVDGTTLTVGRPSDNKDHRSQHGLTRTLIANMVTGVTTGFTRVLEVQGTGYRAAMAGKQLVLSVGYSHQVPVDPPVSESARLRLAVKPTPGQSEVVLYLAAQESGPGGPVVWSRPRFEAPGKPPLLLSEYEKFGLRFEIDYPSVFANSAKYLAAVVEVANDKKLTPEVAAKKLADQARMFGEVAKKANIRPE